MGGETADDPDEEDDEPNSLVWESVNEDVPSDSGDQPGDQSGDDQSTADEKSSDTGDGAGEPPESEPEPASESDTTGGGKAVDLEALITEDPAGGGDEDRDQGGKERDSPEPSPGNDEGTPAEKRASEESDSNGKRKKEQSDRVWNRFGSEEREAPTESGGSADTTSSTSSTEDTDRSGQEDTAGTEKADTTDDGRLWNRGKSEATESRSESADRGGSGGEEGGGDTATAEDDTAPKQGTSFDHLLERSGSGSGNTRPVGSPSVETDLDAFFGDLEEFDRATSGSQVLVISPRGHSITDEVCSQFLTAGGVSGRNAMFVTAVESPAERVDICRNNDDWTGGKVAVIELGDTGTDSDDALGSVGGEEVVRKRVNSPKNLSKTGLLITQTLKKWSSSDQPSILCFHSLTAVGGYVRNETLFQFLFTLQAKLNSFGVTGHYHMDANKHDQQEINTLKTLFDLVVTISRDGDIEVE